MAGKIFISYRRGDDFGFTHALYLKLEPEFSAARLFMDVGHIQPGDEFVAVLNAQIAESDILIAVIGPHWVRLLAERAGMKDDYVVMEIAAGFTQGKLVVPVLVGRAAMPAENVLPDSIKPLAGRHFFELRPEQFQDDCQSLAKHLTDRLRYLVARTEAERIAADEAQRLREASEIARAAAEQARLRAETYAGMTADEVRRREELANWEFIAARNRTPNALRDHLARFPEGPTATYANASLEDLAWGGLAQVRDVTKLQAFVEEFPSGAHAPLARERIAELGKVHAKARATEDRRTATQATATTDWVGYALAAGGTTVGGVVLYGMYHAALAAWAMARPGVSTLLALPVTWLDAILLTVCLVSGLMATLRGLLRELLGVVSWLCAAAAAAYAHRTFPELAVSLEKAIGVSPATTGMILAVSAFVIVLVIVHTMIARMADESVMRYGSFGLIDSLGGLLFGAARGFAIVLVPFLVYAACVPPNDQYRSVAQAMSRPLLSTAANAAQPYVSVAVPCSTSK